MSDYNSTDHINISEKFRGDWCTLAICIPQTYANSSFTCLDH